MLKQGQLDFILRKIPELRSMPIRKQTWFARTAMAIGNRMGLRHKFEENKFVLGSQYVRKCFGASFNDINSNYDLFEFGTRFGPSRAYARSCVPSENLCALICEYIQSEFVNENQLINSRGEIIHSRGRSILSKDSEGRTAIANAQINPIVPINIDALNALGDGLRGVHYNLSPKEERILASSEGMIDVANNHKFPNSLRLQYTESKSGRLYGVGGQHLQNCPREVRKAALAGKFDSDVINCHYTLLSELAHLEGMESEYVDDYVNDRDGWISRLSENYGATGDAGFDRDDMKFCLLAILYGTSLAGAAGTPIGERLHEMARGFCQDANVRALAIEVNRLAIELSELPRFQVFNRPWRLQNVLGKTVNRSWWSSNLTHILQGYEALAMHIAIEHHSDQILLLQHDGYTFENAVDMQVVADEFKDKTGMDIRYEEEEL